MDIIIGL